MHTFVFNSLTKKVEEMHTFIFSRGNEDEVIFHFDGGMTGDLIITPKDQQTIRILAAAVISLVANEYVLPAKMDSLQQLNPSEILLERKHIEERDCSRVDCDSTQPTG